MATNLVPFEREALVENECKYKVSTKVLANVKVKHKQTDRKKNYAINSTRKHKHEQSKFENMFC